MPFIALLTTLALLLRGRAGGRRAEIESAARGVPPGAAACRGGPLGAGRAAARRTGGLPAAADLRAAWLRSRLGAVPDSEVKRSSSVTRRSASAPACAASGPARWRGGAWAEYLALYEASYADRGDDTVLECHAFTARIALGRTAGSKTPCCSAGWRRSASPTSAIPPSSGCWQRGAITAERRRQRMELALDAGQFGLARWLARPLGEAPWPRSAAGSGCTPIPRAPRPPADWQDTPRDRALLLLRLPPLRLDRPGAGRRALARSSAIASRSAPRSAAASTAASRCCTPGATCRAQWSCSTLPRTATTTTPAPGPCAPPSAPRTGRPSSAGARGLDPRPRRAGVALLAGARARVHRPQPRRAADLRRAGGRARLLQLHVRRPAQRRLQLAPRAHRARRGRDRGPRAAARRAARARAVLHRLEASGRTEWQQLLAGCPPPSAPRPASWQALGLVFARHHRGLRRRRRGRPRLRFPLPWRPVFEERASAPASAGLGLRRRAQRKPVHAGRQLRRRRRRADAAAARHRPRDRARAPASPTAASDAARPGTNIALGTTYLARCWSAYGNHRVLATAAYNAGPGRVDRWLPEEAPCRRSLGGLGAVQRDARLRAARAGERGGVPVADVGRDAPHGDAMQPVQPRARARAHRHASTGVARHHRALV
jgi:soluble lytic murein transglycosylase